MAADPIPSPQVGPSFGAGEASRAPGETSPGDDATSPRASFGAGEASRAPGETSPGDDATSPRAAHDVAERSSDVAGSPERRCRWCRALLEATAPPDKAFCGKRCRQTAWRIRKRGMLEGVAARPIHVAYADPPYVGCAWRYYRQPEVDHAALIARLVREYPDGWALSCSAKSLRVLLPLCPEAERICVWEKPHGAHPDTCGLHGVWEAVIVVGGRQTPPGVRDHVSALPARGGGELPGRKPLAFCAALFRWLGLRAGDRLDVFYTGTGVIERAAGELGIHAATADLGELASPRTPATLHAPVAEGLATSPMEGAT